MSYQEVTIVESPVTTRYVHPGSRGTIDPDYKPPQIRVGGAWFVYNSKHWVVVSDEEKEAKFMETMVDKAKGSFLHDRDYSDMLKAFAVSEEEAMEWVCKRKDIVRNPNGWYFKGD